MKNDKQLQKYHSQLKIEGVLRSIIFGSSIGAFVGLIVFLIGALTTNHLLWIGLGTIVFISVGASLALYQYLFKPTIKTVADRVDVQGLEERTITMVELEGSDHFMAKVQREDAQETLRKMPVQLLHFQVFLKPLVILISVLVLMGISMSFMIVKVNAENENIDDPPIVDPTTDDLLFQEMIDNLLTIISEANISEELKDTLYTMVEDLERRLETYDTYIEKYTDILQTRNEILQIIEDNILEAEEALLNIAQELQKYENTEVLGDALLTWDAEEITAAFDFMYDRIDVLLGQELYDVMEQTATDIETSLADAVGTDQAMADALQALADAYRLALENFEEGQESDMLDDFKVDMDQSLEDLLVAVQALKDLVEELLELEEDIEEEIEEVDEFPLFMPYPQDSAEGDPSEDPNTTTDNAVIDGETPYKDVYDSYYQDALDWLTSGDITDEMRQIIENYFDMLQ